MTTRDARLKLYSLITTAFPNAFVKKYNELTILDEMAPEVIAQYSNSADSYIELMAFHISSAIHLDRLAIVADPLVIYSVYMRYYLITKTLADEPQKTEHSFSNDASQFIRDVFLNYWESSVLPGLSKQA